ncbi:pirin family protein [Anaerococcus sp. AGMB00486]|uniref:Pirin family protein n=1 Tax=Anaerococcus faecalis TaxID=2742993 RepID=A0ABX2NCG4_9FIRM|nr:pirin family protein [Anaerococcus faecalis]NVF12295.1 pirin family protein [Anaerococcus faecalis]
MRKIIDIVKPEKGIDGAGVHLYHVLSRETMLDTDPLLLLDAFDSTDPKQYEAGFPLHPHRGIETISYVYKGTMVHKDSLGNEDAVNDGEVQWMTAGSGIFHEEMMPPVEKLYGVQLWLNLKSDDKFTVPEYFAISKDKIEEIKFDNGYLRLLAGNYKDHQGFISKHQPVNYYDIHINPNSPFELDLEDDDSITLFALIGNFTVGDKTVEKFHAGLVERKGEKILIENKTDKEIAVLAFISKRIDEPIAWTPGPIVMNTQEELDKAYEEVRNGTFIKDDIDMNK